MPVATVVTVSSRLPGLLTAAAWRVLSGGLPLLALPGAAATAAALRAEGWAVTDVPDAAAAAAHEGDVVGWSWLIPPYRWTFDARATQDTSAIAFDGVCLRGKCESDATLGYAMLQRVVQVMSARLHSARVRLLDLYGARR